MARSYMASILGLAILGFLPAAYASNVTLACAAIAFKLGSSIVQSASGAEYNATAHGAWSLFNSPQSPTCIVFPGRTSHVQTAMSSIFNFNVDYAVRAGGHSAMTGWNNVQNGILIDFSHMTAISYNATTDVIVLEPGVHWVDAYNTLAPFGVAPVGGRQGDVGTGLLLGGGLSFLSPANGFACDSIKSMEVVLVNGLAVTATANNQYADLFRALKGGANRFGIVTRYELFPVHTGTATDKHWYGGTVQYPESSFEALARATARYVHNIQDPKAVLLVSLVNLLVAPDSYLRLAGVDMFYNGPDLPSSIFGEILNITGAAPSLGPLSYLDITNVLPLGNERGSGQFFGSGAQAGNETLYVNLLNNWLNFTNHFQSEMALSVLAWTPVPQSQINAGKARGGNAMSPSDGSYSAIQIAQQFLPGVSSVSQGLLNGLDLLFQQTPRSPGKPLYMNESNIKQSVFSTYGIYNTLKATYSKYDPTRFNMRHMTGPLGL